MLYDAYCWFMCCIGVGYFMTTPRKWLLERELKKLEKLNEKLYENLYESN